MISKLIKEQLDRCTEADLSNFDEENYRYFIPKKSSIRILVNREYLVELSREALDPNSILNINWNKGKCPKDKYYKISVNDIKGKAIKVDALAFDYINNKDINRVWSGWLDTKSVSAIKEL